MFSISVGNDTHFIYSFLPDTKYTIHQTVVLKQTAFVTSKDHQRNKQFCVIAYYPTQLNASEQMGPCRHVPSDVLHCNISKVLCAEISIGLRAPVQWISSKLKIIHVE